MPSSHRPTILQIIPELDTGGAELSTCEIAEAVVRAGGRAIVLSAGGRMVDRLVRCGAEFVAFPAATKNPMKIIANATAISDLARRERVDLIHARSRAPAWSGLIAARRLKVAFVTTYHGAYKEANRIKSAYNSVMARGDAVIANSNYTADLIRRRYHTPPERMVVIYRGVDLEAFTRAEVAPERIAALRRQWGLNDDTRIVVNAGRLTEWKGQRQVIDAARILKGRFQDTVFILAGDSQGRDAYRDELTAQIAASGLDRVVRLVGHCADMPAAFAAASAAIVASIEPEAFGRAAAEAQAIGCPVISTNIGAPPETVRAPPRYGDDARTGWLVPPKDAAALADAIAAALSLSPEAARAMGARAAEHIRTGFSTTAMQKSTLAVYDRLIGANMQTAFTLDVAGSRA